MVGVLIIPEMVSTGRSPFFTTTSSRSYGGFVFLSHQVGSFMGVWLGGKLYDNTGSYDIVWWIAIGLGVFAALVNLPLKESAIVRLPATGLAR